MKRAVLVVGLALLGITAGPAQATLRVESSSVGLTVLDKNGFANSLTITAATQGGNPVYLLVTDSFDLDFIKYEFGPNCSAGATGDKAVCKRLSGKLNLNMGGGGDVVRVGNSGATSVSANLGTFNDEYHGISGPDDVFTGSGSDDVNTGAGNDDITVSTGSDIVDAGSGNDRIDLPASTVHGEAFVRANGQSGNDTIDLPYLEDAQKVFAEGGAGDDTITTGHGDDFANGEGGADTISTSRGNDQIDSKESAEDKAAVRDTVHCGFNQDEVVADLKDTVDATSNPGGGTCEEVDRSAVGETPLVRVLSKTLRVSRRTGKVKVRMRCPRGVKRLGCKGRLQLRVGRNTGSSRSRRVRYRIKAGRRKTVTLKLTRRDVRSIRRRGRRARGILTSLEKGRKGRKTTIRNPRLRVR